MVWNDLDVDLGSSGLIILPDPVARPRNRILMIITRKVGVVYLLEQTNPEQLQHGRKSGRGELSVGFNSTNSLGGFYGQPVC